MFESIWETRSDTYNKENEFLTFLFIINKNFDRWRYIFSEFQIIFI